MEQLIYWIKQINQFSIVTDLFSVIGAIFAGFAWLQAKRNNRQQKQEQQRLNDPIKIVLQEIDGSHHIELPVPLRRHELNRSELLGYIGMIPRKDSSQFLKLSYINSVEFFKTMDRLQTSDDTSPFIIYCSPQEMEQFDVLCS